MARLSYINTTQKKETTPSFQIPYDESIGAFLFDISGFNKPFERYPVLYNNFKDGKIQPIKNMDDAVLLGIENDGFLNGLLYHHLSQFYDFIGGNQTVYLAFADCSQDWEAIQYMQRQVSGKLFHVGVWTSQPIWKLNEDGSVGFTSLIPDLQAQANEINGKIGESTHTMTPLSIILCGNSNYVSGTTIKFKQIPDALILDCPKVSVILAQNGTDEIHNMQKTLPYKAPVSALGLVMACMALCGAEESIASLSKCDLNKNEGFTNPEWGFGATGTPIDSVHRIWANIISTRGYIVPIDYEELETSYFLSSDQTLSEGDFSTLANNRVMHKCRRAVGTALLPHVNADHMYSPGTHNIDNTSIAFMTDSINTILDSVMRNRAGKQQISGRVVTFIDNDDVLETDAISLKLEVMPANYSGYISEELSHDVQ